MELTLAGLQGRILDFARALRDAGVPVAISDGLDAQRGAAAIDLLDRQVLRAALAATMTSSPGQRPAFDLLFDVYFPARTPSDEPADEDEPRDLDDFLAELIAALERGDDAALRQLAREAVEAYGAAENRDGTSSYFAYRVFRNFNLAGLLRRLTEPLDDSLSSRLARDEFEARLRRFREEVDAELRRRMVAQRGPEDVARRLVRPLPEDVDFFSVTSDEQAEMRRAVRPLARRLATRLAVRRRRGRTGRLDVRRTMRRTLETGGVPLDPAFRPRHVHRPELVLLCDISGSVAAFARFTLMFCHALQGQFSRVRSFAFVDTVDEVTGLFEEGDFADALLRMSSEAEVVWLDGHSDYGHALEVFTRRYPDAVGPRTTLLVLGDARNNYRASQAHLLADLKTRARRLFWLNPEPRVQWGSGDSIATDYARHCDAMVECRNLRQLAAFVETLA